MAVLGLFSTRAFGQQNYQPAKVITLAGDTLTGLVDYRGWDKNPRLITFKTNPQASAQIFHPLDIKGFQVNSERYSSGQVSVEISPQGLDKLTTSPNPIYRTDTTFLKALVTGSQNLYRYKTSDDGREYFYTGGSGSFDLLIYKRYKRAGDGSVVVESNNQYQNQLGLYLSACPDIKKRLSTINYAASSLQKLFATYYTCTNQPVAITKKKVVYQAGVLIGAARTTLRFNPAPSVSIFDGSKYGPTGGLFFYVPLPGSLSHWYINNELTYNSSFKGSSTINVFSSADNYTINSISLSLAYLKLNTLLRFTRPIGAGAIFINAGISNGYAIQVKNEQTIFHKFYSSQTTDTSELFPSLRRYEQGVLAGVGASIKKLSAEVRYERSNGFLDQLNLSSSFERYSLLVGYRLY